MMTWIEMFIILGLVLIGILSLILPTISYNKYVAPNIKDKNNTLEVEADE